MSLIYDHFSSCPAHVFIYGFCSPALQKFPSPPLPLPTAASASGSSTAVYPSLPLPDQGGETFFDKPSYMVAIREATLYDSVIRLRPSAGKSTTNVCGYEIISPDVPFTIDESG